MSAQRVLVVNTGSSSLKFKLYDLFPSLHSKISGLMERIGDPINSTVTIKGLPCGTETVQTPLTTFSDGLNYALTVLKDRVSSTIGEEAKAEVQRAAMFAPLHNPAQLHGVAECSTVFPSCPQVGVFDTAFHQTMPEAAHTYALPYSYYKDHMLGVPTQDINLVVAHLGAGSSMCSIEGGKSFDTTMGMTPLEGLVMATRSGDIDPGMMTFFGRQGLDINDIDKLLNKQSGILGLAGCSDHRELLEKAAKGDKRCQMAFDVSVHRVRKYLGAFLLQQSGKTHGVVFSAGIGENSYETRAAVCKELEFLGITLDTSSNEAARGKEAVISGPNSKIKVLVIPTDEEELIARDTARLTGLMN